MLRDAVRPIRLGIGIPVEAMKRLWDANTVARTWSFRQGTGRVLDAAPEVIHKQWLCETFGSVSTRGVPGAAATVIAIPGNRMICGHAAAGVSCFVHREQDVHTDI